MNYRAFNTIDKNGWLQVNPPGAGRVLAQPQGGGGGGVGGEQSTPMCE